MSSPSDSSSLASLTTLDVVIMGCLCEGGCCRPIIQRVHGRVYADGDSSLSWYQPSDPLHGGSYVEEQPAAGQRSLHIWQQWADATE